MNFPSAFADSGNIHVVIETPQGSRNKYVWRERGGYFELKKVLPAGTSFPLDFGFIPGTKGEDGDPLDVLVFADCPGKVGVVIECRPIGVMEAEQWKEKSSSKKIRNDRILAVADCSLDHSRLREVGDIEPHLITEVEHFFEYYNGMAGKKFRIRKMGNRKAAEKLIRKHAVE